MSISQRQIKNATDKATQSVLMKGKKPNKKDISDYLTKFFTGKIPGLPFFKVKPVEKYSCSNQDDYNAMFDGLNSDLKTMYEENTYQNNKIIAMFDYYMTQKDIVDSELERLALKINSISDAINENKVSQSYVQVFNNFYDIELDGVPERNIPKTTSFIDLEQKKIYNEKTSLAKDKIDLSKAICTVKAINKDISNPTEMGDINNILKDVLNENYMYSLTRDKSDECTIELNLTLDQAYTISTISFSFQSSKAMNVKARISEDNVSFKDLVDIDHTNYIEWNFNRQAVKYITLTIKKYEPDGVDGTIYDYYYSLKNISLVNDKFIYKSTYVSKPITFDLVAYQMLLQASDIIYPNTAIKYYIGLDNGYDKVNWSLINDNTPYDLKLYNDRTEIISGNIEPSYGEVTTGGIHDSFKITRLYNRYNPNSLKVLPGYQMWLKEELSHTVPQAPVDETGVATGPAPDYEILLSDYKSSNVVSYDFIDNEKYQTDIGVDKLISLSQYIECTKPAIIKDRKIVEVTGACSYKLIVNNAEVPFSKDMFNINLGIGINKVQLLIYSKEGATIKHNINATLVTQDSYAIKDTMNNSIFTLINKCSPNDLTNYAVDLNNNLCVIYNPMINVVNKEPNDYIRYKISYKYVKPNVTMTDTTVRLMAVLSSIYDDLSPSIFNYKLSAE